MRSTLTLTGVALSAGAAHAVPMTYDTALKLADQGAPSLAAKTLDVKAARSSAIAAGRLPDPKLGFGIEGFPVSGPNAGRPARDDFSEASVSLMQDVPSSAKRRAARERAAANIGAAQASQSVEGRTVRLGAALGWIDLYYAERRLAALDDIERALAQLRETAPSQIISGAARPAQVLEPQQLTAVLADRRADLVAAVAKARAELARWTDDLAAEISGEPPNIVLNPSALRAGLDRHPSLIAFDATGRQADAEVDAAKADKSPDWSWQIGYQHRDPRFGDMVSVGATVSLPLFGATRQDPIISARLDTANRVRFEREAARRALAASLDGDLADHAMHHERLTRANATLLPLARKRADLEVASYAAGAATLADVFQAFLALAETRIEALGREADAERDAVRINLTYEMAAQ